MSALSATALLDLIGRRQPDETNAESSLPSASGLSLPASIARRTCFSSQPASFANSRCVTWGCGHFSNPVAGLRSRCAMARDPPGLDRTLANRLHLKTERRRSASSYRSPPAPPPETELLPSPQREHREGGSRRRPATLHPLHSVGQLASLSSFGHFRTTLNCPNHIVRTLGHRLVIRFREPDFMGAASSNHPLPYAAGLSGSRDASAFRRPLPLPRTCSRSDIRTLAGIRTTFWTRREWKTTRYCPRRAALLPEDPDRPDPGELRNEKGVRNGRPLRPLPVSATTGDPEGRPRFTLHER